MSDIIDPDALFDEVMATVRSSPDVKYCKSCAQWKPLAEFYLRRDRRKADQYGRVSWCKPCGIRKYQQYYQDNKERLQEEGRARSYMSRHSGRITPEEAQALALDKTGQCEICADIGVVFIDHCHSTQKRRGFLCKKCNSFLGLARDNEELLFRAVMYLQKYRRLHADSP